MAKKIKVEGELMLDELLSIRQLLEDELAGQNIPTDNIPVLHDIDYKPAPGATVSSATNAPEATTDKDSVTDAGTDNLSLEEASVEIISLKALTLESAALENIGLESASLENPAHQETALQFAESEPAQPAENLLVKKANELVKRNAKSPEKLLKPLTRKMLGENPFLPKQALARLNASKSQIAAKQSSTADASEPGTSTVVLAEQPAQSLTDSRQLLINQGDEIIEQLVKDSLPKLEEELRQRLRQQLDSILASPDDQ